MRTQGTAPARVPTTPLFEIVEASPGTVAVPGGILVLSGYGIRLSVERGHLVFADGVGDERRGGRLNRISGGLKRLVVLGQAGTVSLEALRWLHDTGASFVQIGHDGEVLACFAPLGSDDPRVRRAQALAVANGRDLAAVRALLRGKVLAQAELAGTLLGCDSALAETMKAEAANIESAPRPDRARHHEAIASKAYWRAWTGIPVSFGKRDAKAVPAHWRSFASRSSLQGENRRATDPANAILNYGYALLEAECRMAALAVGLDPGLGVLHTDIRSRDSFALDLMEPVRAEVDRFVLGLLRGHTFNRKDFFETAEGTCRLLPPAARLLAAVQPVLSHAALAEAERLVKILTAETAEPRVAHGTSTHRLRSVDPMVLEKRKERGSVRAGASLPNACLGCGVILASGERRYCDACVPWKQGENVKARYAAGQAALAKARAEGNDPAHGGEAGKVRGRKNADHDAANRAWEQESHPELEGIEFERDVLPHIAAVPLSRLAGITGLSIRYCSLIRRGLMVPHRRHCLSLKGA